MSTIDVVKVRAEISIGNTLRCETPYVGAFNVTKSRGQFSTFSAQLKVNSSVMDSNFSGDNVVVKAGVYGNLNTIFTGIIKKATMTPCFDDPSYVMLNLQGTDILSYLVGKKYTRRCKASESTWVSIQGVSRPGFKSSKFSYQAQDKFFIGDDPANSGEKVIQHRYENNAKIKSGPQNDAKLTITYDKV